MNALRQVAKAVAHVSGSVVEVWEGCKREWGKQVGVRSSNEESLESKNGLVVHLVLLLWMVMALHQTLHTGVRVPGSLIERWE